MKAKSVYTEAKEIGAQKVNGVLHAVDSGLGAHWVESRTYVTGDASRMLRQAATKFESFNWARLKRDATIVSGTVSTTLLGAAVWEGLNSGAAVLYILEYGMERTVLNTLVAASAMMASRTPTFFPDVFRTVVVLNAGAALADGYSAVLFMGASMAGYSITGIIHYSDRILYGAENAVKELWRTVNFIGHGITLVPRESIAAKAAVVRFLRNDKTRVILEGAGEATAIGTGMAIWGTPGALLEGFGLGTAILTGISVAKGRGQQEQNEQAVQIRR